MAHPVAFSRSANVHGFHYVQPPTELNGPFCHGSVLLFMLIGAGYRLGWIKDNNNSKSNSISNSDAYIRGIFVPDQMKKQKEIRNQNKGINHRCGCHRSKFDRSGYDPIAKVVKKNRSIERNSTNFVFLMRRHFMRAFILRVRGSDDLYARQSLASRFRKAVDYPAGI